MSQREFTNPLTMMSMYNSFSYPFKSESHLHETSLITIYNALTGAKVSVPISIFQNIESLKQYIAETFKIEIENIFLLTPFGIKLKFNMVIHNETNEIYAFDRKFFSPNIVNQNQNQLKVIVKNLINIGFDNDIITMIKPRDNPLISLNMGSWAENLENQISKGGGNLNSSDLDFDNLRLLLNCLKRNSGWASALLSDFKNSLLKRSDEEESEAMNNILKSMNVLIQYVTLLFNSFKRDYEDINKSFKILSNNPLLNNWQNKFKDLEKLTFSFKNRKNNNQIESIKLSEMLNFNEIENNVKNANVLINEINSNLVNFKNSIEEINLQLDKLMVIYENMKSDFLNGKSFSNSTSRNIQCKEFFTLLEESINKLSLDSKSIPSFDELITTVNFNSTLISDKALKKIQHLLYFYKDQIYKKIPNISLLANNLYDLLINESSSIEILQETILSSFFVAIVKIQLCIRQFTKELNKIALKPLSDLKFNVSQISTIVELPLIFGSWTIAILDNLKYGLSIEHIAKKVNEILEMLDYLEKGKRKKWYQEFLNNLQDKVDILDLQNDELKSKFVEGFYRDHEIISSKYTQMILPAQNSFNGTDISKRQVSNEGKRSSFDATYFQPFNKIIQNFRQKDQRYRSDSLTKDHPPFLTTDVTNQSNNEIPKNDTSHVKLFLISLTESVTLKDIYNYIGELEKYGFSQTISEQLKVYLGKIGIDEVDITFKKFQPKFNEEIIIRKGDMDGFGTYDGTDELFMNTLGNFIKGFEVDGFKINLINVQEEKNIGIDNDDDVQIEMNLKEKSYISRIHKLENLLHENRYDQFQNRWLKPSSSDKKTDFVSHEDLNENILMNSHVSLGQEIQLPPSHISQKFAHLSAENEKLIVENKRLHQLDEVKEAQLLMKKLSEKQEEIDILKKKNFDLQDELRDSKNTNNDLNVQLKKVQEVSDKRLKLTTKMHTEIEELKSINRDLIENMSHKEEELKMENKINQKEKNEFKLQVEDLTDYLSVLENTNETLIDTIKEGNFIFKQIDKIVNFFADKIQSMSIEMTHNLATTCLILETMGLIMIKENGNGNGRDVSSDNKISKLGNSKEDVNQFAVKRMKGLRNKKKELLVCDSEKINILASIGDSKFLSNGNGNSGTVKDNTILEVVSNEIVENSKERQLWLSSIVGSLNMEDVKSTDYLSLLKDLPKKESIRQNIDELLKSNEEIVKIFNNNQELLNSWMENLDTEILEKKFQEFKAFTSFDKVMIISSIHNRFDDVESLARKLTKEKLQLKNEIKVLKSQMKSRLVLRNFCVGDLVLFLKTLVPHNLTNRSSLSAIGSDASYSLENSETSVIGIESFGECSNGAKENARASKQPWAVFNVASPNYYLKNSTGDDHINLENRDWFVGRITNIEEFIVDISNFNNVHENPFKLGVDTKWYFVEAIEEKVSIFNK